MKKVLSAGFGLLWVSLASASPTNQLGTKPGGTFQTVQPAQIGFLPILQLLAALAFVTVLLKWVLPKFADRLNKNFSKKAGQLISIEETTSFPGGNILVVKARGRTLLLGSSGTHIAMLADLTEIPKESPSQFEETLQKVEASSSMPTSVLDPAEALLRLNRLQIQDNLENFSVGAPHGATLQ